MKDVYWTTADLYIRWSCFCCWTWNLASKLSRPLFHRTSTIISEEMWNCKLWVTSALLCFFALICVCVWCECMWCFFVCTFSKNFALVLVLALIFCVFSDLVVGLTDCEIISMCLSSWFTTQRSSLTLQLPYITLSPPDTENFLSPFSLTWIHKHSVFSSLYF